ncbi:teichoic acid D-Ala incorporation-associated protein DltX [Liquorilactobacillus hordei]
MNLYFFQHSGIGGIFLKQFSNMLIKNEVAKFILKTVFYTVIIMGLVYFFSYSGMNGPHFIYNEF